MPIMVAELLAADCEKAWIHPGWEDTMQNWYECLEEMKKNDEKGKMEDMHQQKVVQMIERAEGSAGLLHKNPPHGTSSGWWVILPCVSGLCTNSLAHRAPGGIQDAGLGLVTWGSDNCLWSSRPGLRSVW